MLADQDIVALLRDRGISPTQQRVTITRTLLAYGEHLAAEDVFRIVNKDSPNVSKATVYNTLGLLAREGVIGIVIADPNRVFYDPNTKPHHHFYDQVTGKLTDVDAEDISVRNLPPLPENKELVGVDIVVRVRDIRKE